MKPIDLKSITLGLLLGVILMAAMAAAGTESEPVGRFQVFMADGKAIILDTRTGQAWMDTYHARVINEPDFLKAKVP
jgi:hypothetical protein